MPAKTQRESQRQEILWPSAPPEKETNPSRMHVAWTTPAGCQVNTEPSNKVQQGTKIARNTVNNKVI